MDGASCLDRGNLTSTGLSDNQDLQLPSPALEWESRRRVCGLSFLGFAEGIWREKEGKRSAGLVERIGGIRQELEPLATSALALVSTGPRINLLRSSGTGLGVVGFQHSVMRWMIGQHVTVLILASWVI